MVFHWEKQKENLKNGLLWGLFLLCCGEYIYNRKKKLGCLPIYKALPKYVIYPSAFCPCCHSFAQLQMKINEFWKWEETCWSQRSEFASEALDSASCDSRLLQVLGEWVLHVKCWVWVSITKWCDDKCGLGGCDSSLLLWLWLWPWPIPLFCRQVGDEESSMRVMPKIHSHLAPRLYPPCLPLCSWTQVLGVWFAVYGCLHFPLLCKLVACAKNSLCPEALSLVRPIGWLHFSFGGGVFVKLQGSDNWQYLSGVRYLEFGDNQPIDNDSRWIGFLCEWQKGKQKLTFPLVSLIPGRDVCPLYFGFSLTCSPSLSSFKAIPEFGVSLGREDLLRSRTQLRSPWGRGTMGREERRRVYVSTLLPCAPSL